MTERRPRADSQKKGRAQPARPKPARRWRREAREAGGPNWASQHRIGWRKASDLERDGGTGKPRKPSTSSGAPARVVGRRTGAPARSRPPGARRVASSSTRGTPARGGTAGRASSDRTPSSRGASGTGGRPSTGSSAARRPSSGGSAAGGRQLVRPPPVDGRRSHGSEARRRTPDRGSTRWVAVDRSAERPEWSSDGRVVDPHVPVPTTAVVPAPRAGTDRRATATGDSRAGSDSRGRSTHRRYP